jgi:dual specificity phosphatase 12
MEADPLLPLVATSHNLPPAAWRDVPFMGGRLWLGSKVTASSAGFFDRARITHVLNAGGPEAAGFMASRATWPPVVAVSLPAQDVARYPILALHAAHAVQFVDDALSSGGNVLVHCHAGVNRSVALLAAYLAIKGVAPVADTVARIAAFRPCLTNPGFRQQLAWWQETLDMGLSPV